MWVGQGVHDGPDDARVLDGRLVDASLEQKNALHDFRGVRGRLKHFDPRRLHRVVPAQTRCERLLFVFGHVEAALRQSQKHGDERCSDGINVAVDNVLAPLQSLPARRTRAAAFAAKKALCNEQLKCALRAAEQRLGLNNHLEDERLDGGSAEAFDEEAQRVAARAQKRGCAEVVDAVGPGVWVGGVTNGSSHAVADDLKRDGDGALGQAAAPVVSIDELDGVVPGWLKRGGEMVGGGGGGVGVGEGLDGVIRCFDLFFVQQIWDSLFGKLDKFGSLEVGVLLIIVVVRSARFVENRLRVDDV